MDFSRLKERIPAHAKDLRPRIAAVMHATVIALESQQEAGAERRAA